MRKRRISLRKTYIALTNTIIFISNSMMQMRKDCILKKNTFLISHCSWLLFDWIICFSFTVEPVKLTNQMNKVTSFLFDCSKESQETQTNQQLIFITMISVWIGSRCKSAWYGEKGVSWGGGYHIYIYIYSIFIEVNFSSVLIEYLSVLFLW